MMKNRNFGILPPLNTPRPPTIQLLLFFLVIVAAVNGQTPSSSSSLVLPPVVATTTASSSQHSIIPLLSLPRSFLKCRRQQRQCAKLTNPTELLLFRGGDSSSGFGGGGSGAGGRRDEAVGAAAGDETMKQRDDPWQSSSSSSSPSPPPGQGHPHSRRPPPNTNGNHPDVQQQQHRGQQQQQQQPSPLPQRSGSQSTPPPFPDHRTGGGPPPPFPPSRRQEQEEDADLYRRSRGQQPPPRGNGPPPMLHPQQQQRQQQQQQQQQQQRPPPHHHPRSSNPQPTQRQQQQQSPPTQSQPQQPHTPSIPTSSSSSSFSNLNNNNNNNNNNNIPPIDEFNKELVYTGLKRLYRKNILPLEISSKYGHFHSPPLSPSDFEAKPMVLLLGQYSVGKTSFIKYLLGKDFPGMRIGPEPTTDRFTTILHGPTDKIVPGAALCSQTDRPFRGLSPFGNDFLSRLEGIELDSPILHNVTLVDTPGILAGQKQSQGRNYDYDAVMKWFAERADLIIIMFDAHKLDISDELKRVIELMGPHADKVRVVLNKADGVGTQQLLRVYGALMWSLGKVMNTPEVCRVYIGSFWGRPLQNTEQANLLNSEKADLFRDISLLPRNAIMRRINELVKRARSVKVHAYIIHYLRKQLPYTWGKKEKQARLIGRLERELVMCARRYELPRGDFPPTEPLRQALLEIKDLSEFPKLDKKLVQGMDKVFSVDIPELLEKARG